jgi:hypothetical protein
MTKIRYVVQCTKHGSESSEWAGKQVVVAKPKHGTDRKSGGCPQCNAEKKLAETKAA